MGQSASLRLDSHWTPTGDGRGVLALFLHNLGDRRIGDFRLALTSLFRIETDAVIENARIVEQVSNYLVIAPPEGFVLHPGAAWSVATDRLNSGLRHYTDGPKSAYLVIDGGTLPVAVTPTTREGDGAQPPTAAPARPARLDTRPPVAVMPFPNTVAVSGWREPSEPWHLASGPPEAISAFAAATGLAERLFPDEPPVFAREDGSPCDARLEAAEDGSYRILFAPSATTVVAGSREGFLHGFITLGQIYRAARLAPSEFSLPESGEIADGPPFGWRGVMLDVARQVYGVEELRRLVDRIAWLKLNRFHLHLTDDEGWRLDVPGYPQVAEIAAWRGHGLACPALLGSPPEPYGGVYTRSELGDLVRHAGELGVTIVPEIDIPGHCYCVVEAIRSLKDPRETGTYRSIQGFPNNALNPALPETYAFLEAVLTEVAGTFSSPWIHIGGDEVAERAWLGSPRAKAMMRERGWHRSDQLQSYFLRRAQALVRDLGRGTGAWQEAALGGGIDAADAYLVAWRDTAAGLALAKQGYDVVMAPAQHYYLDMAQSGAWWEPGGSWAGTVSLKDTYAYDPGADWPEELKHRLIGVQACLWSENLHDRRLLDHLLYPRLAAVAESAWTPASGKDFSRFNAVHPLILPGRAPTDPS